MLEELDLQLPKSQDSIRKAYASCSARKKFLEAPKDEFTLHLDKAKSDFRNVRTDLDGEAWDWAAIKSYYSIHHAANAILVKFKGLFCKDRLCLIIALKHFGLIPDGIYESMRRALSGLSDVEAFEVAYSLGKVGQYDVRKWKRIGKGDALAVHGFASEFLRFAETECEKE